MGKSWRENPFKYKKDKNFQKKFNKKYQQHPSEDNEDKQIIVEDALEFEDVYIPPGAPMDFNDN